VRYCQASALDLPFADATFDVVWTQHASMNIEDKSRLYGEMFRVVSPGGRLLLYDIVAGPGGPIHFPVFWADGPSISFLMQADEVRDRLQRAGFGVTHWDDLTELSAAWFRKMQARPHDPAAPPTGPRVLLGPISKTMAANMTANLSERRLGVVRAVLTRPGAAHRGHVMTGGDDHA
jgi:SAM-dependent methyltransferase